MPISVTSAQDVRQPHWPALENWTMDWGTPDFDAFLQTHTPTPAPDNGARTWQRQPEWGFEAISTGIGQDGVDSPDGGAMSLLDSEVEEEGALGEYDEEEDEEEDKDIETLSSGSERADDEIEVEEISTPSSIESREPSASTVDSVSSSSSSVQVASPREYPDRTFQISRSSPEERSTIDPVNDYSTNTGETQTPPFFDYSPTSNHASSSNNPSQRHHENQIVLPPISSLESLDPRGLDFRLPEIVDLTSSSPSAQLITSLAPRSYSPSFSSSNMPPRPSRRRSNHNFNTDMRNTNSTSNTHGSMQLPEPTLAATRQHEPKRRRISGLTVSSSSDPPTPELPAASSQRRFSSTLQPISTHTYSNAPASSSSRPTLPRISDVLNYSRMPSPPGITGEGEEDIESIDLREVDDEVALTRVLARQREEAVLSQNKDNKPVEDTSVSALTSYKCPVCMDVLTNATSTTCGHLFCHKCILDTLKFGERRAEDEGKPARGNCPVCRKPLPRSAAPRATKHMIPLKFMHRGKKTKDAGAGADKGKGKGKERAETQSSGKGKDSEGSGEKRKRNSVIML